MIGIDTETEPFLKKVRGPKDVKLWGVSVCNEAGDTFYTEDPGLFSPYLYSIAPKVAHNSKFDLDVLDRAGYDVNGEIDDTYLMAVLDDENRKNDLKSLAKNLLGAEVLTYKEIKKRIAESDGIKLKDVTEDALRHHPIFQEYAKNDAKYPKQLFPILETRMRNQDVLSVYKDIELPLVPVVRRMEARGIRLDVPLLRALRDEYEVELEKKKKFVYLHTGYGGWDVHNSHHLADILYNKLKLCCPRYTDKGKPSTDKKALAKLENVHPAVKTIVEFKELHKLLSGFIYPLLNRGEQNEILHPVFNQLGANTGRGSGGRDRQEGGVESGYDTSIQTIPVRTEHGRRLRAVFIPRGGFSLLSADFSQIELRVLAHLSEDEAMTDAFNKDLDIHEQTSLATGCTRYVAKTVNFAYVYGSGLQNIAETARISVDSARKFMSSWRQRYKKVPFFVSRVKKFVKENSYVLTAHNRRRRFPNIHDPQFGWMFERAAVNTVIQGTAAEICKLAMLRLDKTLRGSDVHLLAQVHDELLFEVPRGKEEEIKKLIKAEMESVLRLKVPLKASVNCGRNWLECK